MNTLIQTNQNPEIVQDNAAVRVGRENLKLLKSSNFDGGQSTLKEESQRRVRSRRSRRYSRWGSAGGRQSFCNFSGV